jgi:hypothetical protein
MSILMITGVMGYWEGLRLYSLHLPVAAAEKAACSDRSAYYCDVLGWVGEERWGRHWRPLSAAPCTYIYI